MNLEVITAEALDGIDHGFFTRKGGASSGVYAGLNCGLGSTDQSDIVAINRRRVAQAMNVAESQLCGVHQVHSNAVVRVTERPSGDMPRADALVTDQPDLALVILTADCQPVLFADKDAGVIGAAHAGWRGAMDGILERTVEEMVALGATRDNITAVIGPSISQAAYEVGPEFLDDFIAHDPDNVQFFASGQGDRYMFNLPAFGLNCLRKAGVGHAEWTRHCTYADPARFYSYRRSVHKKEADYGRLLSTIRL
ncbi:peptidoglycan editing factor PgeF [Pacificibacter marinus]|uniref:peptidoglycan editing factor PgeF n=1 Tax=Pacificibacter marinus TaxID=658057 RepID=UPI001C0778B2|nr:peptidoglycan editing factor PgeF [Pacificibacter marinus]MBU2868253.1 peptidoglycan editing factor PgeF [Pacificibacter marinus]